MVNWGAVSPIIVAIIGASGVIVPILINQLYNKPNIDIDIKNSTQEDPKNSTIITLSNIGTMPATNLSLIITAHNEIIDNITNVFSTANVTLVMPKSRSLLEINSPMQINSSSVELHVKKFANGGGSIIKLAVHTKDATDKDYTIYATYDQGSNKRSGGGHVFFIFSPSLGTYGFFAELIVIVYFFAWLRKHFRKRFFIELINEIIYVRKTLRINLSDKDLSSDHTWTFNILDTEHHRVMKLIDKIFYAPVWAKHKLIKSVNDYTRIDDFYSKLAQRNSYIRSCIVNNYLIDDNDLLKLNKKCLELAEEVLEKIDWSRYE